jgi:hypothetical protein
MEFGLDVFISQIVHFGCARQIEFKRLWSLRRQAMAGLDQQFLERQEFFVLSDFLGLTANVIFCDYFARSMFVRFNAFEGRRKLD